MTSEHEVVQAHHQDIEAIGILQESAFAEYGAVYKNRDWYAQYVERILHPEHFWNLVNILIVRPNIKTDVSVAGSIVVETNNDIWGKPRDDQRYGHIRLLCVDKRFRRNGIARALTNKAIDLCARSNCEKVMLRTNKLTGVERFYTSIGFKRHSELDLSDGLNDDFAFEGCVLDLKTE